MKLFSLAIVKLLKIGISIIEASYCNVHPILPQRLSYTEIFDFDNNSNYFYSSDKEFYKKLKNCISNYKNQTSKTSNLIKKYDWRDIVHKYDKTFSDFI